MLQLAFQIKPYQQGHAWFFDDFSAGIMREPLTDGVPELIIGICEKKNIDQSRCVVCFNGYPWCSSPDLVLDFRSCREDGSTTYRQTGTYHSCWLCPCLSRYFHKPPERLYVSVFGYPE